MVSKKGYIVKDLFTGKYFITASKLTDDIQEAKVFETTTKASNFKSSNGIVSGYEQLTVDENRNILKVKVKEID